jgi:hypothetical protein
MTSAEDYRRRAEECFAIACEINNPNDKATLLEIADAWRKLAHWAAAKERDEAAKDCKEQHCG